MDWQARESGCFTFLRGYVRLLRVVRSEAVAVEKSRCTSSLAFPALSFALLEKVTKPYRYYRSRRSGGRAGHGRPNGGRDGGQRPAGGASQSTRVRCKAPSAACHRDPSILQRSMYDFIQSPCGYYGNSC